MRVFFLIIIVLFCFSFLNGQNLVLNPSFEEYSQIPDEYSEFNERYNMSNVFFAKYWRKIIRTSPDYYHKTSNFVTLGIPINNMGDHPSIEGDAYTGFVPVFYSGVLEPLTVLDYQEPYLVPDLTKSMEVKKPKVKPSGDKATSLKVYPNPANEYITIEYNTDAEENQIMVEVIDESGRLVYNSNLIRKIDQIIIDTRNFKSGNYIIRLVSGNKSIGNANVIISR